METAAQFIQFQTKVNIAPSTATRNSQSSDMAPPDLAAAAAEQHKSKRLTACLVCRKRKLKCDSARPKCASCSRLGHACGYEETRKKSGPKQGYVKKLEQKSQTLEQRLAQLEKLLATHQTRQSASPSVNTHLPTPPRISPLPFENLSAPNSTSTDNMGQFQYPSNPPSTTGINPSLFSTQPMFPDITPAENILNLNTYPLFNDLSPTQNAPEPPSNPLENQWAWDVVSLGLNEELPPEDLTDKLTKCYFEKAHKMLPFLHRARFMAGLQLPPNIGVPVPLRYTVWALGATLHADPSVRAMKDIMYMRARRALNDLLDTTLDTLNLHRISTLQALILLSTYEFLHAIFGHAWMNCGRTARMSVYFNLMRFDEPHLVCKQTLQEPKDWIDQEERRRTFWAAFILDRFASLGTGWAATFNEDDITTFLPGPEDEFQAGIGSLGDNTEEPLYPSTKPSPNRKKIGTMGAIARVTAFLGRLNVHVNRPHQEKEYIVRHKELDNLLATINFSIPSDLKYVAGSTNMQSAFLQHLLSVSTILLNQAALYKSQLTELPLRLSDLINRCQMGAFEISNTIRASSNVHITHQCAYTAFCIYVGARIFVEMLRQPPPTSPSMSATSREDFQNDLTMMLAALQTFKEHVPLAGHFLMQLEADLNGLENVISTRPYDVNVGYAECHIFKNITTEDGHTAKGGVTVGGNLDPPKVSTNSLPTNTVRPPFDMRGVNGVGMDRFYYLDCRTSSSLTNDTSPSLTSVSTVAGGSVHPISSESTPNTASPENLRQFDPDKFFGDMTTLNGMDVSMNIGQDVSDGGVEFFTEMLGVQLNSGNTGEN